MNVKAQSEGFTLLEVLVALVVAGVLVAILANGAVNADARLALTDERSQKLLVAQTVLDEALAKRPLLNAAGSVDDIEWEVSVIPLAKDPRGTSALYRVNVAAGSDRPVILSRRIIAINGDSQ